MKNLFKSVIQSVTFKVNIEKYMSQNFHHENPKMRFYTMTAQRAKYLLDNLEHNSLDEKGWIKANFMARRSDNGTFTAPKSPIRIDTKRNVVLRGSRRLHALSITKKPAIVWVELVK